MKFYAVRKGYRTGIFTDWESCQAVTRGYPKAVFKSFKSEVDAQNYLDGNESFTSIGKPAFQNEVYVYTDGSFKDGLISFGMYLDGKEKSYKFCGCVESFEYSNLRNVAGEIFGTLCGVELAKDMGFSKIVVIYDYQGIESWYTGEWQAKNPLALKYTSVLRGLCLNNNLSLSFMKVEGHSGNFGNDIADKLAKRAGNMKNMVDIDLIFKGILTVSDISCVNCF